MNSNLKEYENFKKRSIKYLICLTSCIVKLFIITLSFVFCTTFGFSASKNSILKSSAKVPFEWAKFKSQPQQANYILEGLNSWQNLDIQNVKCLRVVYFYPKDRLPIQEHRKRWDEIMSDIQNFYRVEMKHLGFGDVTLSLEREKGKLFLHEVRGVDNDDGYTYKSGGKIRKEVFANLKSKGINPEEETILIVCGLSRTDGKKVTIYSPYYGMGANHNRGICFTADMKWLSISGLRPDSLKTILQVKEHRGYEPFSLARFNTTYIGGTIHELGHGLSLPHNLATKDESKRGTALMGAGNYTYRKEWRSDEKGSFLTFAHAIRLVVHPLFSGTNKQCNKPPNLTYKALKVFHRDDTLQIEGTIETEVPTVAMIAYNDRENKGQRGYMVNKDYDATTWTSVISPGNKFQIQIANLREGNHQIRLVSVHANGATTTKRMHYSSNNRVPNLTRTQEEISNIVSD